jgi:hypothetical protein
MSRRIQARSKILDVFLSFPYISLFPGYISLLWIVLFLSDSPPSASVNMI